MERKREQREIVTCVETEKKTLNIKYKDILVIAVTTTSEKCIISAT